MWLAYPCVQFVPIAPLFGLLSRKIDNRKEKFLCADVGFTFQNVICTRDSTVIGRLSKRLRRLFFSARGRLVVRWQLFSRTSNLSISRPEQKQNNFNSCEKGKNAVRPNFRCIYYFFSLFESENWFREIQQSSFRSSKCVPCLPFPFRCRVFVHLFPFGRSHFVFPFPKFGC